MQAEQGCFCLSSLLWIVMSRQLLAPENCYLHIIDPQIRLMSQIYDAEQVVETIRKVVHCARIIGLPILANTQYKKGLGPYVPELEELMDGVARPDKIEFNALAHPETRALVSSLPASIHTGILVGVETHICIYQTAMGMLEHGLVPWVVTDGVSSRKREHSAFGLARLEAMGAAVGPAEMIIYELLGKAGTPEFKAVLPYII